MATAGQAAQPARRRGRRRAGTGAGARREVRDRQDDGDPAARRNGSTTSRTRPCRSTPDGTVHPHAKPLSVIIDRRPTRRQGAAVPRRPGAASDSGHGADGPARGAAPRRTGPEGAGASGSRRRADATSSSSRRPSRRRPDPLVTLLSLVDATRRGVGAGVRRDPASTSTTSGGCWPRTSHPIVRAATTPAPGRRSRPGTARPADEPGPAAAVGRRGRARRGAPGPVRRAGLCGWPT